MCIFRYSQSLAFQCSSIWWTVLLYWFLVCCCYTSIIYWQRMLSVALTNYLIGISVKSNDSCGYQYFGMWMVYPRSCGILNRWWWVQRLEWVPTEYEGHPWPPSEPLALLCPLHRLLLILFRPVFLPFTAAVTLFHAKRYTNPSSNAYCMISSIFKICSLGYLRVIWCFCVCLLN